MADMMAENRNAHSNQLACFKFDPQSQEESFSQNNNIDLFQAYRRTNFSYRDDDFVYQF